MEESIAKKTARTSIWGAVERVITIGIQFIVTMILARLLSPEAYGIIAMIMVFISISQQFVESGIVNALIRKKDCTSVDLSTAFYFNILVSAGVYAILFLIAPFISSFYKEPLLTQVVRVYGLCIILQSFSLVQNAILTRELQAKKLAYIATSASLISGLIGVFCAVLGLGVWALVMQSIFSTLIVNLLLWSRTSWLPKKEFSIESMKYLWAFGSKMLLTGIISALYRNIYSIVIGKRYDTSSVGVFNTGQKLSELLPSIIESIFVRNSLPIMAQVQDDKQRLRHVYREYVVLVSFLAFPTVFLLGVLAKPFVLFFLSEKWIESVIVVQIFCLICITYPASAINLNLIQVFGRSDIMFKAEIIKKSIGVIVVFAMLPYGLVPLAWGGFITSVIAYGINLYYAKKLAGISFVSQIKDLIPCFISSVTMSIFAYLPCLIIESNFLQLLFGFVIGTLVYFIFTRYIYKMNIYEKVFSLLKNRKS